MINALDFPTNYIHKYSLKTSILFEQELRDCKSQMTDLTNKWYQAIRIDNNTEDDDEDPETISQRTERTNSTATLNSSRGNMI